MAGAAAVAWQPATCARASLCVSLRLSAEAAMVSQERQPTDLRPQPRPPPTLTPHVPLLAAAGYTASYTLKPATS